MSEPTGPPAPAAQYLRLSTLAQGHTLAGQAATIGAYATSHGFEIVASYEDAGRSGVTARGRAGLARLLADVLAGEVSFTTILVLDVSRWGRYQDPDEAAHYEFLCRSAGISVRYCTELFDDGPTASIMKQLKRVMAGEYSRELSAKIVRSKQRGEALGRTQGGPVPYGIQRREVRPDGSPGTVLQRSQRKGRPEYGVELIPGLPHEQLIARKIFKRYVTGRKTVPRIAAELNEAGEMWHDGSSWTADRVELLLRCDLLVGRQLRGKLESRLGNKTVRHPPEAWRLVHRFQPVISPALYKAAQQRRAALRRGTRTREELLDDLRGLLSAKGRLSRSIIRDDATVACTSTYCRVFGSIPAAYALIGYVPPKTRSNGTGAEKAEVLKALRRIGEAHGRVTMEHVHAAADLPSIYAIKVLFGSLRAACELAGVRLGNAGRAGSSG